MFEIEKTYTFEAGHVLPLHDGLCKHPHGHSYVLKVRLRANKLVSEGPKTNMIMDFSEIGQVVKPMIENYFDHHWLNDSLNSHSPTVEFIAKWIYDYLSPHLPLLYAIVLQETATSQVTYIPE